MSKTIVENATKLSMYVFANDKPVIMGEGIITVGSDPVDFYVCDLNSSNATMHTDVTAPDGWYGDKHFFDGTDWTNNPNWVDPNEE